MLLGFAPVSLAAGATGTVTVAGSVRPLLRWTDDGFVPAAPQAVVEAAAYSGDPGAVTADLQL